MALTNEQNSTTQKWYLGTITEVETIYNYINVIQNSMKTPTQ